MSTDFSIWDDRDWPSKPLRAPMWQPPRRRFGPFDSVEWRIVARAGWWSGVTFCAVDGLLHMVGLA